MIDRFAMDSFVERGAAVPLPLLVLITCHMGAADGSG